MGVRWDSRERRWVTPAAWSQVERRHPALAPDQVAAGIDRADLAAIDRDLLARELDAARERIAHANRRTE